MFLKDDTRTNKFKGCVVGKNNEYQALTSVNLHKLLHTSVFDNLT